MILFYYKVQSTKYKLNMQTKHANRTKSLMLCSLKFSESMKKAMNI